MQQAGEHRIAAPRGMVWTALNDPVVLARCIPGCESFDMVDDGRFTARVRARVGPLNAAFRADIELTDARPPNEYTLNGTVKGGPVGFASGSAHVRLDDDAGATWLRYRVRAHTGGKLAQLASRLVDSALRKLAGDFFSRFNEVVSMPAEPSAGAPGAPDAPDAPS
jgi:uncharacterized protein